MTAARRALLVSLLALSGCASAWSASPPGSRNGVGHGAVATVATWGSDKLTGTPWYGFAAACALYLGHESEENRMWSDFHVGGLTDSVLDVVVPCVASFGLSLRLR